MDPIDLKYWHWIVIGALAGAALGFSWSQTERDLGQTGRNDDFIARVGQVGEAEATKGLPRFRNIRVLPGVLDPSKRMIYTVTYDRLGVNREGAAVYQPQKIYATDPFDGGVSVQRYLENRKVPFDDQTQAGPGRTVAYGAASGAVVIGLVWPTILRLLVGAGFARPEPKVRLPKPKSKKAKWNWWPFGRRGAPVVYATPVAAPPTSRGPAGPITEADTANLFVAGQKSVVPDPSAAPVATREDEEKEYAGDYYPVARPHGEKHPPAEQRAPGDKQRPARPSDNLKK